METQTIASSSRIVASSLVPLLIYPRSVRDVAVLGNSVFESSMTITWTAPAVHFAPDNNVFHDAPVAGYIVMQNGVNLIDSELLFNDPSSRLVSQTMVPSNPGVPEQLSITGLIYDTRYSFAVKSFTKEKNRSYLSNINLFGRTLTRAPTGLIATAVTGPVNRIDVVFNPQNTDTPAHLLKFEVVCALDGGFVNVVATNTFSSGLVSVSTSFANVTFGQTYFIRARSFNNAVPLPVPGPWSAVTLVAVGLASPPFSSLTITTNTATADWNASGGFPIGTTFQVSRADNLSFTVGVTSQPVPSAAVGPAVFGGLTANTTYYFRTQAFSSTRQASVPGTPVPRMTSVHRASSARLDAGALTSTAAGFTWTAPSLSNPNTFFYEVQVATAPNFTGSLLSSRVDSTHLSTVVPGLVPNTTYFARLLTLNGTASPSTEGPTPVNSPTGGFFITPPLTPTNLTSLQGSVSPAGFSVGWDAGANSPATTYLVEASTDNGFPPSATTSVTTPPGAGAAALTGLSANTGWHARVTALSVNPQVEPNSPPSSPLKEFTQPATVTNLQFQADTTTIVAAWTSTNGPATTYSVKVSTVGFGGPVWDARLTTSLTETFLGLVSNTAHFFQITTLADPNGHWPAAGPVQALGTTLANAPAPVSPAFGGVTSSSVVVRWSHNGNNPSLTRYAVSVSSDGFVSSGTVVSALGATSMALASLTPDTLYEFHASGINVSGSAGNAFTVLGSTPTLPEVPVIAGFTVDVTSVTPRWTSQNPAGTSYHLQRMAGVAPVVDVGANIAGSSATDVGLATNTFYSYQVRARSRISGNLSSAFSSVVSTWTLAARPWQGGYSVFPGGRANQLEIPYDDNPPAVSSYAIQVVGGKHLGTKVGSAYLLDSSVPVWRTRDQWDPVGALRGYTVVVATGLTPGTTLAYAVTARNGAGVPTLPSLPYINGAGPGVVAVRVNGGGGAVDLQGKRTFAVTPAGVIEIAYTRDMDSTTLADSPSSLSLVAVRDNRDQGITVLLPFNISYIGATRTAILAPVNPLPSGSRVELRVGAGIRDISGNFLPPGLLWTFSTVLDPTKTNVLSGPDGRARAFLPQGSLTGNVDLAINDDPINFPLGSPTLPQVINQANDAVARTGPFGGPFLIREFNLFNETGDPISGLLPGPATLFFDYADADGDGVVDGTAAAPVRARDLSISWLDPATGVWVKVPGSQVDAVARTVSVEVSHFSVYALTGAPFTDLSSAHAFPVPYRASTHTGGITFRNLSSRATIKIYTLDGRLVKTLSSPNTGGALTWNPVVNEEGDAVASDVYIYRIENSEQKKIGKIMVIR
jgi:hypothetical protein